jgi:hypothetical protein
MGNMSRRHPHPPARPARILELYGQDLRWTAADRGLHLDADTAARLHDEGFTMATVRVGLWRTKRVSLNRWAQQGSSRR